MKIRYITEMMDKPYVIFHISRKSSNNNLYYDKKNTLQNRISLKIIP